MVASSPTVDDVDDAAHRELPLKVKKKKKNKIFF